MKSWSVTIQMKATEQNFYSVLFSKLFKVVIHVTFEFVFLQSDHSNLKPLLNFPSTQSKLSVTSYLAIMTVLVDRFHFKSSHSIERKRFLIQVSYP